MKYDIVFTQQNTNDEIIDTYLNYPNNPYIFGKFTLEQILLVLSSELLHLDTVSMKLIPRAQNDLVNIFEVLKNQQVIATINGDWNINTAMHLLRLKKCIASGNYDFIETMGFLSKVIAIDGDKILSKLVSKFIGEVYDHTRKLEKETNESWKKLLSSYLNYEEYKT